MIQVANLIPYAARASERRARFRALHADLRKWFMPRRTDWNRMGPMLPLWFRLKLKRVDRRLVMQFVPPRSEENPDGTLRTVYPNGVWTICARIPRTHWLAKRAIYVLTTADAKPAPPTMELIRILREARRLRRRGDLDALERQYADAVGRLAKERQERSRERLTEEIAATMRKMQRSTGGGIRVFVPDAA